MQSMVLNSFAGKLWISLSEELIIYSDTVVGQCFSMAIVDALANLQEFQIVINGLLVVFDVIIEDSDGIVCSAFVPHLPCAAAPKGKHLVVFKPTHHTHICGVVNLFIQSLCLLLCSAVEDGMILDDARGSIEEKRQLNPMRMRRSHLAMIAVFVETTDIVLFSKRPTYFEGLGDIALMAAVSPFGPALHNKNINRSAL